MAPRRIRLISISAAVVAVLGSYGLYMATAQMAAPELAQSPMNITNVIPPAFIMGVDNSGSMSSDETLFRTATGPGYFVNGSFFNSSGVVNPSGGTTITKHLDGGYNADFYGALRNPAYNRAFFNPHTVYLPWRTSTGGMEANSNVASARKDPRNATPVTNFTTYLTATESWPSGKVVPEGTWVYNDETCDLAPGSSVIANAWVQYASDKTLASDCSIQFRYQPSRVYLDTAAAPPPGFDLSKRVLVKGVGPLGADMYRYDYVASNFTTGGADAVQNFANWWTYYGNRNRAMIGAMTHAVSDFTKMRIGYTQINTPPTAQGDANDPNVVMRDMGVQADRDALYAAMRALNASGNTPTRRATARMIRQFSRTDAGAPIKLQCQKNAAMLFTDGYTNESPAGAATSYWSVGNVDGGYPAPYGGGTASSDTIADYAMYGYITNPRPDLPTGKVPVPHACAGAPPDGMDCNKNLHVNFYGVTLGARGAVYDVNATATANPYANPPNWGASGTMNLDPRNVDDIWHAALNSRGEFVNASSPADITEAMRRILALVNEGATPSGTIGVTGARIGTGSLTVEPRYESTNNGTDWYGKLTAYNVTANPLTGATSFSQAWEASAKIEAQGAGSRTIKYGTTAASVVPTVQDFDAAHLTLAGLCAGSDPLKTISCTPTAILALDGGNMTLGRVVDYLRGSRTDEGKLRTRTTVLGDIVNSSPVVSASTDDYGYRTLGGSLATSYATYLATKKAGGKSAILVGANDGMFHVIDGHDTSGGQETFAYVPATSVGHMGNLVFPYVAADKNNQKFEHRYFVDGPVAVSDVYMGGSWKTIAVATSGAGGRSVFALDITNPSSPSVLWEINNLITGAPTISNNIGYVLGKPVIVPIKDNSGNVKWKAIFGNGYNSTSQQASLFVVDVATGSNSVIVASESPAPAYNGLGNVSVVDLKRRNIDNTAWIGGRDGYADTAYAADQNGAVWKFDLLANSVALGGQPLFVAKDSGGARQTITGGLTLATGPAGGVMVYFGTGSFSFTGDPLDTNVQTMYGVLDKGVTVAGRANLLQQTIGVDTGGFRETSTHAMAAGKSGWYIDLPAGERFVGHPRIEGGVVFFPTYEPSATAADDCSVTGQNWLYGLNTLSGAAGLTNVRMGSPTGPQPGAATGAVALITGGTAPVKDVAVMTAPRVGMLDASATDDDIKDALDAQCSMVVRVAGAPPMYLPRPCGRQSWRQVR
ncbi:MAG: pilus assembly protein [Xanthomonadales bacterium]|nr:pilus assembly protein [Xanthomonadales bacterium]MCA0196663.1 pilus assembly protein [Pseudomonadota bacterium]HRF83008.1 PilC/PilY family type IV pilus protein [Pseudoxanthomonas sp.]